MVSFLGADCEVFPQLAVGRLYPESRCRKRISVGENQIQEPLVADVAVGYTANQEATVNGPEMAGDQFEGA